MRRPWTSEPCLQNLGSLGTNLQQTGNPSRHRKQGIQKCFLNQLLTIFKTVADTFSCSRNPVRATFVALAEDWPWGSAYARQQPAEKRRWLATPTNPALPRQWRSWVNKAETDAEVKALRHCIARGLPFGDDRWTKSSTVRLSLESATRPRGRPRKQS